MVNKFFDRSAFADFLSDYLSSGQMAEDFRQLDPEKRLAIATRLAAYVMPKLKAIGMDVVSKQQHKGITANPLFTLFPESEEE